MSSRNVSDRARQNNIEVYKGVIFQFSRLVIMSLIIVASVCSTWRRFLCHLGLKNLNLNSKSCISHDVFYDYFCLYCPLLTRRARKKERLWFGVLYLLQFWQIRAERCTGISVLCTFIIL